MDTTFFTTAGNRSDASLPFAIIWGKKEKTLSLPIYKLKEKKKQAREVDTRIWWRSGELHGNLIHKDYLKKKKVIVYLCIINTSLNTITDFVILHFRIITTVLIS